MAEEPRQSYQSQAEALAAASSLHSTKSKQTMASRTSSVTQRAARKHHRPFSNLRKSVTLDDSNTITTTYSNSSSKSIFSPTYLDDTASLFSARTESSVLHNNSTSSHAIRPVVSHHGAFPLKKTDTSTINSYTPLRHHSSATTSRSIADHISHSPPPISPNSTVAPSVYRDVSPLSSFSGPSSNHSDPPDSTDAINSSKPIQHLPSNRPLASSSIHDDSRRLSATSQFPSFSGDQSSNLPNTSNKPTAPMVFPDPTVVFDSSLIPPISQNGKKLSVSSSSSSTSSSLSKNRPKKSSFLGKFIYRKDSKDDHRKTVSHKSSQSSLTSTSTLLHRPSYVLFSNGRQALHHISHKDSSDISNNNSYFPEKPTSENVIFQKPGQSTTVPDTFSNTQNTSNSTSNFSDIYQLDTDLDHMAGIVNTNKSPDVLPSPPQSTSISTKGKWQAPESWNTTPEAGAASSSLLSQGIVGHVHIPPGKSSLRFCARVFRDDDTFSTLSCPLGISVSELSDQIARKFFLDSPAGYQLTIRVAGLTKVLTPEEQPLVYQCHLLGLMGYTSSDRLQDVGRDDLSYLCKFKFSKITINPISDHDKTLLSRDFSSVNISLMNLQTVPIFLYPHASKIQYLDLSGNPSMSVPSDFIQSCSNLIDIRFVRSAIISFPANITLAPNLRFLDLRQNLILSIPETIPLDRFSQLSSLDLQGNFLTQLPSTFTQLRRLKYLDLSSNMFSDFPPEIMQLPNLLELDISFNKIKTLPEEIGNLQSLEKLAISNSYIRKLPDSIVSLSSIKELDFRYNLLQNIDLLGTLPNLSVLHVSKNSITSFGSNFSQLKRLSFDRNPITNVEFKNRHSTLTTLSLFKAQIAALLDSLLDTIPFIEKLVLDRNHITTLPPKIGSLKHLRHLSIVANQLDAVPPEIGLLSNLERLDLHDNNIIQLPEEIWTLSSLVFLNVASNLLEVFPKNIIHSSISHSSVSSSETTTINDSSSNPESDRRPSALSISSSYDEYRPKSVTIASSGTKLQPLKTTASSNSILKKNVSSPKLSLAHSLLTLILCDNQLNEESFAEISLLTELQVLNISYNEFGEIPFGALRRLTNLQAFYVSGNNISSIPGDDLEALTDLNIFVANSNKIHNLPAELGKVPHLTVLDVGSNILKYNIHNWPYDWNWRFNRELRYLNFSGNRRLEVSSSNLPNSPYRRDVDMSDFSILSNIRILGLMDVTLTAYSAPDQTENCRVRTYGSEIHSYSFGLADFLGNNKNLSITDMVLERFRGKDNEIVIGLFDGRNTTLNSGNKVSKLIQETLGGILADELKKLKTPEENVTDALRRTFLNTNKEIGNTISIPTEEVLQTAVGHRSSTAINLNHTDGITGSCATIIYVQGNKLYIANAGDSMAIMAHTSGEYSVLTTRHDPTTQIELARIRASGGVISSTGKLDDILDVSRAIGFYSLIPHIHAAPSILAWDITESDEMIILASKQLWEYVSYQIAVDIARTEKTDLMRAAAKLRDFAIAYGASDKIMVMVLGLGLRTRRDRSGYYGGVINGNMPGIGGIPGNLSSYGKDSMTSDGLEDSYLTSGSGLHPSVSVVSTVEEYPSFKRRRDKGKDSELARLGGEVAPPQGQLAIVFTDIKNSTSLWESHQAAMSSAIKHHNVVMRRQIRLNGGYEVKTEGDAFVVSFPTPVSALLWCLTVQQSLMYADWPATILETPDGSEVYDDNGQLMYRGLSVRMGIHWGSPFCETDPITRRMDYFGPMVNKAARVSAVADGGQITLSSDFVAEMKKVEDEYEYIKETGDRSKLLQSVGGNEALERSIEQDMKSLLAIGWEVKELGEFKLKGLENPEFISLVYPKPLLGRFEHHLQSEKKKSHVVSSTYGSLNVEDLTRLRLCATRMEAICSQIGGGDDIPLPKRELVGASSQSPSSSLSSSSPSGDSKIGSEEKEKKNTPQTSLSPFQQHLLTIPLPNNEFEYGMFLNGMVTRIENALTTLALRVAVHNFDEASGGLLRSLMASECEEVSSTFDTENGVLGLARDVSVGGGSVNDLLETTMKALELATKHLQETVSTKKDAGEKSKIEEIQPPSTLDLAADLVEKEKYTQPFAKNDVKLEMSIDTRSETFYISSNSSNLIPSAGLTAERNSVSTSTSQVWNADNVIPKQETTLEPVSTRTTPPLPFISLPDDLSVAHNQSDLGSGVVMSLDNTEPTRYTGDSKSQVIPLSVFANSNADANITSPPLIPIPDHPTITPSLSESSFVTAIQSDHGDSHHKDESEVCIDDMLIERDRFSNLL